MEEKEVTELSRLLGDIPSWASLHNHAAQFLRTKDHYTSSNYEIPG